MNVTSELSAVGTGCCTGALAAPVMQLDIFTERR